MAAQNRFVHRMKLMCATSALSLAAAIAPAAPGDVLVCDFTGTSPGTSAPWTNTSALQPGVAYSGWAHTPSATFGRTLANAFGFNINAPGDHESTLDEAIGENEYISFTLTPTTSPLNLSAKEVAFSIQRQTYHAPRRYAVFSAIGGFTTSSQALYQTLRIDSSDFTNQTFRFFLPLSGYDAITTPVQFRLYAYGANYNHATALTAFSITPYAGTIRTLRTAAAGNGSVDPATPPGGLLLRDGTTVTLSATPSAGHRFAGWSGTVSGLGTPYVITMTSDRAATATFTAVPSPQMQIGMNLGGISDYGSDWIFTDWFRRIRSWRTRNADNSGAWDTGFYTAVPMDANGWVTQVPFTVPSQPPQMAHTILNTLASTGTARLTWQGAGTIRLQWPGGSTTLTPTGGPGQFSFSITTVTAPISMEIRATTGTDYLRNFKLEAPGYIGQTDTTPFYEVYTQRLAGMSLLRFMDWQATNASPLTTWAQRTTTASHTQSLPYGAALEWIAALTNSTGRDAWVCIPHAADDDYIRRMARFLRDNVRPDVKIWVEYSNETWNTAGPFSQTTYVQDAGQARNLDADRWRAGQLFAGLRSAEIWRMFEEEFGTTQTQRLVKVLATQGANSSITTVRTEAINNPAWNPTHTTADALALAPYFGVVYTPAMITANGYPTVDDVVTTLSIQEIEQARQQVRTQKALADVQGWRLVCYEGGQHFVGTLGGENDTTLTAILIAANRDPRMYDRYREYLDMLQEEGIELFANFSYVYEPGKFGSWGVLESQDQSPAAAHKYRALTDWITANPVPVKLKQWRAD